MARTAIPNDDAKEIFDDFPAEEGLASSAIDIAKKWYEKHGIVPQAVGEDSPGKLATAESTNVYWNATKVSQAIYSRRQPDTPIYLMPGDPVIGLEFKKYSTDYGGPLTLKKPDNVVASSSRDAAYFELRSKMVGKAAAYASKVTLERPANFDSTTT